MSIAPSFLQQKLPLADLIDLRAFTDVCQSFAELYRVGLKVFDEGGHRLVDDRERRLACVLELVERDLDERGDAAVGDGLRGQRPHDGVERAVVAQRAVGELLHERARGAGVAADVRVERGGQRRAREHGTHGEGGLALRLLQARPLGAARATTCRGAGGCAPRSPGAWRRGPAGRRRTGG